MDWPAYVVVGGALAAFVLLKRVTLIRVKPAQELLGKGARVVDVRSEAEYRQGHLAEAVNIPLNRLRDEIGRYAPDKEQPLLLHCLSGGRSGIAKGMLRRMGYRNVFNLGSYGRASRIVGGRTAAKPTPSGS